MIKLEELSYNDKVVLTIEFDENEKTVILVDENKNTVRLGPNGISLTNEMGDINIISKGHIKIEGTNVDINAKAFLTVKGVATAELSAQGQTTVKGAMVMIN